MNIINSLGAKDFIGIIVSIILVYVARFYYKYLTRPNPLPGPVPLPIVGDILAVFYYAKGDVTLWMKLLQEKHGDIFETHLGSFRRIVLARADYVEKLMSSSTKTNYVLRSENMPELDELNITGKGILFNTDIPTWRFNRQFLSQVVLTPSFSKEALLRTPILYNELNGYWKEIGEDVPIDFSIWIHKFTTESIFQLVVGLKVSAMTKYFNDNVELSKRKYIEPSPIDEKIINFDEIIDIRLRTTVFLFNVPAFLRHTIFKKKNDEMHENRNETQKIITKIIDHRRKEIEDHKELGSDMLTLLIKANTEQVVDENSKPLTNDQIFHILIEAISGGIETTANLLCFVVYHLAHHPNVLVRLREELDTIFDSDNNRQMTMEDLSKMRYTEAIIKECARLINPAKLAQRNSSLPDTIIDREWPANTAFFAYIEGIHHNPIHWKDPLKFNPDRFMDSEPQKNTFLMFGGGVRICPGRKLALITMKCLVSLIYKNLDITLVDMDAPLKLKNKLVNACTELKIRVKQREA